MVKKALAAIVTINNVPSTMSQDRLPDPYLNKKKQTQKVQ
jgi:hypothetical protein